MKSANLQWLAERNRPASALVGLLIVIALVFLVYFVQWYLRKTAKDPDICYDLTPWKEWRLRQSSEKPQQEPSEEQPDITETVRFDTNAELRSEPRGEIWLAMHPDGTVMGSWYGRYYKKPKINFDIMGGGFNGHTYPRKIYRGEDGEDRSKLYFIAKGTFLVAETDFEKDKLIHRSGDIYVTGWVSPDYSAMGKITITSDEKYFETFDWKAIRPD